MLRSIINKENDNKNTKTIKQNNKQKPTWDNTDIAWSIKWNY